MSAHFALALMIFLLFPQTVSDSQLSGQPDFSGPSLAGDVDKRKQRNKRGPKGGERPAPRSKKRRKEEEERQAASATSDPVMTHLKQVRESQNQ